MFRKMFVMSSVVALACSLGYTQATHRGDEVTGMSGTVSIIPNQLATHTTVAFTSNTPVSTTSNQIVFVLQAENAAVPPAWSGPARILIGDGFLAVIVADNPGQKYLLKFRDRYIPPSLSKQKFDVFEIVGIARYGEHTPLTNEQIAILASTGRCGSRPQTDENGKLITESSNGIIQPMNPDPPKFCPVLCTSGGDGASQCSAGGGGCSVTCSAGYYSCCNSASNTCGCCSGS